MDVLVTKANTDERTCAWMLLLQLRKSGLTRGLAQGIEIIFADAGFSGEEFQNAVKEEFGHIIEVVRREPEQKGQKSGFAVLPSRWLIEQNFGCQGRYHRLSRDYEQNHHLS